MKQVLATLSLLCLGMSGAAHAAEPSANATSAYSTGSVELQYKVSNVSGSKAKASEYDQAEDGARVFTRYGWFSALYHFDFDGSYSGDYTTNTPTDAQANAFDFTGVFGKSEHYEVTAYADRMGHNLSDGLTNKASVSDIVYARKTGTSNDFTYNRQRTRAGVEAEVSHQSPLFAGFKLETLSVEGLMPLYNVNEGNVPYPVDYDVNTVTLETGYRSSLVTFVMDGSVDSLQDDVGALRASRTGDTLGGNTRLPVQDSTSYRLGSALTYRMPSLLSTLMVNGAFANLTSDTIDSSRTSGNTALTNWDEYTGDIKTTSVNAALTSTPRKGMTTKVYGRYYQRQNDSEIEYNEDWLQAATASAILQAQAHDQMAYYAYDTNTLGGEVNQRLGEYRLLGGLEWQETNRERYGITEVSRTDDARTWGQVRVPIVEDVAGRIRYDFLNRDSSDTTDTTERTVLNPSSGVIAPWFSYMDTAGKHQHKVTSGVDWSLADNMELALDYTYKLDDYTHDAPLGLTRGESHGGLADLSYTHGPAQFHVFGGVEFGESTMHTRLYRGTGGADIGGADPDQADSTTAYNWGYTQRDTTYTLGAGMNVDLVKDRLNLQVQYDFTQNDGETDLHIPEASGVVREDLTPVNDYTQHNVNVRLTQVIAEGQTIGVGYTYTKLDFEDWGYNQTVTDAQKLSDGYYNVNPSYEAHAASIFYRYTF